MGVKSLIVRSRMGILCLVKRILSSEAEAIQISSAINECASAAASAVRCYDRSGKHTVLRRQLDPRKKLSSRE